MKQFNTTDWNNQVGGHGGDDEDEEGRGGGGGGGEYSLSTVSQVIMLRGLHRSFNLFN